MLETPSADYSNGPSRAFHQPLYSEKIVSDRKIFFMDLKENDRGRFVKITEDVRGRRDTIMLPVEALDEFLEALNRVADFDDDLEGDSPDSDDAPAVSDSDAPQVEPSAQTED